MDHRIDGVLAFQAGTISRRQLLAAGLAPHEARRLLRRRDLNELFRGVYVDHTGAPTWMQRAWGGVLALEPAVLWGPAALYYGDRIVHVGIDRHRSVTAGLDGVQIHYVSDLAARAEWHRSPPRMGTAAATIDVAGGATTDMEALAQVARMVQARRTTPRALLAELDLRGRSVRGAWLRTVLDDVAAGVCSALEYGFRDRVLRRHGLPTGELQQRGTCRSAVVFRDWSLGDLVVELDGRLHHDSGRAREADFDRDLETAATGRQTLRISWGQVFERSCLTAAALVRVMSHLDIPATPRPCGPACSVV